MSEHDTNDDVRGALLRLGGEYVDLWQAPDQVRTRLDQQDDVKRATAALREQAVRDVASAYLVRAAAAGSEPALDRLVALWHRDVVRWCRWGADRAVNPDDASHDVVERLMRDVGRIRDPERFRAWLWQLTANVLREHRRSTWLRRWAGSILPLDAPDPTPAPGQRLELTERSAAIQGVLQMLGVEQRQLLWLAYVEGLSRSEIADLLDVPPGSLNRRLTAARRAFRRRAEARGLDPASDGGLSSVGGSR